MKRGFTLIELLVYMAILGFIIVVAGRAYSDATGMRVRTQNMTKATEEVNRIAEIIKEDLSQMGIKVWGDKDVGGNYVFDMSAAENVYWDKINDSSSFELERQTDGNDKIQFKKISYDGYGKYEGIHLITWHVSNKTLYRSCRTEYGTETSACPTSAEDVIMAEDAQKFIFNPSKPSAGTSFGGPPATLNDPATFALLSRDGGGIYHATTIEQPSQSNYNKATLTFSERNSNANSINQHQVYVAEPNSSNPASNFTNCRTFEFQKGETYAIKFKTPVYKDYPDSSMITLFNPGKDHMAVGFRKNNGDPIEEDILLTDFMFYPPQERKANLMNQYFEFSVPNTVQSVCVAFTFAFYSGTPDIGPHKGTLQIQDFELLHKEDGTYEFERDDNNISLIVTHPTNKKNVKAFELVLEVKKGKEAGSTCKHKDGNDKCVVGYVIPVPNNGVVPQ